MTDLGPGQIAQVAREGGFPESAIPMAVAIALAESSGDTFAHNTNRATGDNSYGLWQINMLDKMGPDRRKEFGIASNNELFNPVTNARAANKMSGGGKNWSPWSTYPAKAALYLPQARRATATAKGTATQANWFGDWWDNVKKGWESGSDAGSSLGDSLNDLFGTPSPEDLANGNLTNPGGSGLWSIGTLLTGLATALTNPDNWRNWAYVGIGGALVISGLVIVTKPYAQQVANAAPTARLVKVAKGVAKKG